MLSNRVAKLAEKSLLVGNSPDEFRGIVHDSEINNVEIPVVFGNINCGYAIMIKKAQNITHFPNDTKNAMAGTQTFICDVYADEVVYNSDALAKLTVGKA